jgi:succinoglycan biosynthesis transport protein ExoP
MPDIVPSRQLDPIPLAPLKEETLAPSALVQRLRRRWPLLLALGLAFGIIGYVATVMFLPKQYTSSGMVAIDTRGLAIPELAGALNNSTLPEPRPLVDSEALILRSPALIKDVVDDLKLEADPEFNGTLKPPGFVDRLKAELRDVLPPGLRQQAISMGLLPPVVDGSARSKAFIDSLTVAAVLHNLAISNDGRSLVLVVQFTANTPKRASEVVNSLMNHYIASKREARDAANREAHAELNNRIEAVRKDVEALEQKIQATRQHYELVQTRAGSVGQQQLEDLSTALTHASADRAQLEANYLRAVALARSGGVGTESLEILNSTTVSTLREREAAAARRVADLSATLGASHPLLSAARAQLAAARAAIASEANRMVTALGAQVQAAREREADLREQLTSAQGKASNLATVQAELTQLEKDADARRNLYATLLQRSVQTQSDKQALEPVGASIVNMADTPIMPSSPHPTMAAAIGMLSGVAFGGFISLLRRRDREPYLGSDEITADTGLAVLASIPRSALRGRAVSLPAVVAADPSGAAAEALRLLRSKLRFVGRGAVPRTILFVSTETGEGASSVAAAFARLAALDGMRVLLLDSDLSNPSLAGLLGVPPSNGLIETLLGQEHWRDAVVQDVYSPLDCLLSSSKQEDGNQLLETTQLQNLLADARDEYSFVVLDAQPAALGAQAVVLTHAVDIVAITVEAGTTSRGKVHQTIEAISGAARKPPVVVLNKV